ncbi:MAG: cytochrome c3 family protein [Planctomycetes bacterium]|nr:cytochrome c3 family protein [Planctomycetota bacterium]
MREPGPDYASRQYERPNQPWVCGLASDGQACPAGPTAGGACPALAECVPTRDGDRWMCNRSPLRGGVCAEGPSPEGGCGCVHRCRPVRSLRSIRGRFVTACTLLAAGVLTILLSADWRDRAISPGPLAQQHAQLLENETSPNPSLRGRGKCAECHSAAERSVAGWAGSLAGFHGGETGQSQRCMECHKSTISTEFALVAHNVAPQLLRQITASGVGPSSNHKRHELACATCHREHRGAQFDLVAMNDAACQSCHQQRYQSFSTDHPDFGVWPYERRTRIVFNHASHQAKHFAEKKQAFACRLCHVEDATQSVQLLASFENACALCHDEKIATSVAKGLPFISLPTIDVDALKTAGHDIGPWPEAATGDFDGRLPPMMKLLLAADQDAAQAMTALGADFDFLDVDPDDPVQLAACAKLAAAIRSLVADIGERGPVAVRERLSRALAPYVEEPEVSALMAGLSVSVMHEAANWFPGIDIGKEAWPRDVKSADLPARKTPQYDPAGTWFLDDVTLSIRYRPAAHADSVLTSWLKLLAATPNLELRPLVMATFRELSSPTAPGLCASCHSVERVAEGQMTINWRAYNRTTGPRSLTKFSHGPHLLLPQLSDCTSCHAINNSADTAAAYSEDNPHTFVSEFAPISKQQCAQCHTAKAAGESCQKCHNYHVDEIEAWRLGGWGRGEAEPPDARELGAR